MNIVLSENAEHLISKNFEHCHCRYWCGNEVVAASISIIVPQYYGRHVFCDFYCINCVNKIFSYENERPKRFNINVKLCSNIKEIENFIDISIVSYSFLAEKYKKINLLI